MHRAVLCSGTADLRERMTGKTAEAVATAQSAIGASRSLYATGIPLVGEIPAPPPATRAEYVTDLGRAQGCAAELEGEAYTDGSMINFRP